MPDVERFVDEIDTALRARSDPDRAERERAYLKSDLAHYGASVPDVRSAVKAARRSHPGFGHDEIVAAVTSLWSVRVHERRLAAVELLHLAACALEPHDLALLERLLRESGTWALVDVLAAGVVSNVVERHPELDVELDRWAKDDDFWIRRSALLALLPALRRGEGDFDRFTRYADAMLDEKEFFIRKAIGWVLRETGKRRPDLVYEWVLPRAARASGVTLREAVKPLSEHQRVTVLAAR